MWLLHSCTALHAQVSNYTVLRCMVTEGINKGKRVIVGVFHWHVQILSLFLTRQENTRLPSLFVSTPVFCPGLSIINLLWMTDRWPTLFFPALFWTYKGVNTRHLHLEAVKVVNAFFIFFLLMVIMSVDKPFNLLLACSRQSTWLWLVSPDGARLCTRGWGGIKTCNCRSMLRGHVEYGSCAIRPFIDSCPNVQTKGDVGHLSSLPVGGQKSCGQEFTSECQLINGLCTAKKLCPAFLLTTSHRLCCWTLGLHDSWLQTVHLAPTQCYIIVHFGFHTIKSYDWIFFMSQPIQTM